MKIELYPSEIIRVSSIVLGQHKVLWTNKEGEIFLSDAPRAVPSDVSSTLCEICKEKPTRSKDSKICEDCGENYRESTFSAPKGCGKTFMPWGEEDVSGYKESSWTCGDKWNGKPLLCSNCLKNTKNEVNSPKKLGNETNSNKSANNSSNLDIHSQNKELLDKDYAKTNEEVRK